MKPFQNPNTPSFFNKVAAQSIGPVYCPGFIVCKRVLTVSRGKDTADEIKPADNEAIPCKSKQSLFYFKIIIYNIYCLNNFNFFQKNCFD